MSEEVVPIQMPDGSTLCVVAGRIEPTLPGGRDEEREIAGRVPSIEEVASAVSGFTQRIGQALKRASPTRFTVEFECEIGFEAGALVAVIGKGSARSAFRVTMEWDQSAQPEERQTHQDARKEPTSSPGGNGA